MPVLSTVFITCCVEVDVAGRDGYAVFITFWRTVCFVFMSTNYVFWSKTLRIGSRARLLCDAKVTVACEG